MASHSPYEPPRADLIGVDPALSGLPIEGALRPEVRVRLLCGFLALLTLWFAYDGWLNTDPELLPHRTFNRVGTVLLGVWSIATAMLSVRVERTVRARRSSLMALSFLSPAGDSISVATVPWMW